MLQVMWKHGPQKGWSPSNTSNVKNMMYDSEEVEAKLGGEWIVDVVQIRDNVNGMDEIL